MSKFNDRTRPNHEIASEEQTLERASRHVESKAPTEMLELDKHGRFPKSKRRPQRKFSAEDDENLLLGFEKYGPVWHNMRSDPDLGFNSRHPTDLRDRFRIKYPDRYAKAGYKLKPRKERPEEERNTDEPGRPYRTDLNVSDSPSRIVFHIGRAPQAEANVGKTPERRHLIPPTTSSTTPNSTLKSHGIMPYLFDSTPLLLNDDTVSEDEDGNEIPITLNRNILQWADANPSSMSMFPLPPMTTQAPNNTLLDTSLNLFDDMHINSLATLKLPSTTSSSTTLPILTTNSHPNILSSSLLTQPTIPDMSMATSTSYQPTSDARIHLSSNTLLAPSNLQFSNSHTNTTTSSSMTNSSSLNIPRTPNLPTIVFPHVPAASARRTMHNLPAPADLLLGIDSETNRENQMGVNLDETISLGIT